MISHHTSELQYEASASIIPKLGAIVLFSSLAITGSLSERLAQPECSVEIKLGQQRIMRVRVVGGMVVISSGRIEKRQVSPMDALDAAPLCPTSKPPQCLYSVAGVCAAVGQELVRPQGFPARYSSVCGVAK